MFNLTNISPNVVYIYISEKTQTWTKKIRLTFFN